jgi:hypothetical protein
MDKLPPPARYGKTGDVTDDVFVPFGAYRTMQQKAYDVEREANGYRQDVANSGDRSVARGMEARLGAILAPILDT